MASSAIVLGVLILFASSKWRGRNTVANSSFISGQLGLSTPAGNAYCEKVWDIDAGILAHLTNNSNVGFLCTNNVANHVLSLGSEHQTVCHENHWLCSPWTRETYSDVMETRLKKHLWMECQKVCKQGRDDIIVVNLQSLIPISFSHKFATVM